MCFLNLQAKVLNANFRLLKSQIEKKREGFNYRKQTRIESEI
jgi:hypothetical protein